MLIKYCITKSIFIITYVFNAERSGSLPEVLLCWGGKTKTNLQVYCLPQTIPPMEEMAAPVDESQPIFTLSTDALPLELEDLTQAPSMIPSEQVRPPWSPLY